MQSGSRFVQPLGPQAYVMQSVRKGIYLVFLPLVTVHIRALTPRALASVLPLSFCLLALLNFPSGSRT